MSSRDNYRTWGVAGASERAPYRGSHERSAPVPGAPSAYESGIRRLRSLAPPHRLPSLSRGSSSRRSRDALSAALPSSALRRESFHRQQLQRIHLDQRAGRGASPLLRFGECIGGRRESEREREALRLTQTLFHLYLKPP
ncbi:hypothetical protein E2320_016047 [Naja naja]|nr:hypothetical protein E2320_016047 [Naja naja]